MGKNPNNKTRNKHSDSSAEESNQNVMIDDKLKLHGYKGVTVDS